MTALANRITGTRTCRCDAPIPNVESIMLFLFAFKLTEPGIYGATLRRKFNS
jgi:hypothetical protein